MQICRFAALCRFAGLWGERKDGSRCPGRRTCKAGCWQARSATDAQLVESWQRALFSVVSGPSTVNKGKADFWSRQDGDFLFFFFSPHFLCGQEKQRRVTGVWSYPASRGRCVALSRLLQPVVWLQLAVASKRKEGVELVAALDSRGSCRAAEGLAVPAGRIEPVLVTALVRDACPHAARGSFGMCVAIAGSQQARLSARLRDACRRCLLRCPALSWLAGWLVRSHCFCACLDGPRLRTLLTTDIWHHGDVCGGKHRFHTNPASSALLRLLPCCIHCARSLAGSCRARGCGCGSRRGTSGSPQQLAPTTARSNRSRTTMAP